MDNTYAPEEDSAEARAIAFVLKHGMARTATISCAVGMDPSKVGQLLEPALKHGILVACDVTTPSGEAKEYRPAGKAKIPEFKIKPAPANPPADPSPAAQPTKSARQERAETMAKELNVKHVVPARADSSVPPVRTRTKKAQVAKPAVRVSGRQDQVLKVIADSKQTLTIDQIAQLMPDATRTAIKQACCKMENSGKLTAVVVKGRTKAFGVPEAKLPAPVAHTPAAKKKPRPEAVSRSNVHSEPVVDDTFRCGILSDGALRLDGAFPIDGSGIVLDPKMTNVLVGYLRRLDMLGAQA